MKKILTCLLSFQSPNVDHPHYRYHNIFQKYSKMSLTPHLSVLRQHLIQSAYQHHITSKDLFSLTRKESNFFTNPDIEIFLTPEKPPIDTETISLKKKKDEKVKEEQYPIIKEVQSQIQDLEHKILANFKEIHYLLKLKFMELDRHPFENSNLLHRFRSESFALRLGRDSKLEDFTIAYFAFNSTEQASDFHKKYILFKEELQNYIPKTYTYFINYVTERKVYLTYMMGHYLPLEEVAKLLLNNDNNHEIKELMGILELKRQGIGNKFRVENMNIGFTLGDSSLKWLPFEKLIETKDIVMLYKELFVTSNNSQMNLENLCPIYKRREKFKNQLYFLCEQHLPDQKVLVFSLNQQPIRLSLVKTQIYSNFQSLKTNKKKNKKIVEHSSTQYIKVFVGKNFKWLAVHFLNEYLMTRQFSSIEVSPSLYWFEEGENICCYFKIKKYVKINEVFTTHMYLFEVNNLGKSNQSQLTNTSVKNEENNHYQKQIFRRIIDQIESDLRQQLQTLHSHHVIHGDVSLLNIVYDQQQTKFKLIDFQMAQRINQEVGEKTRVENGQGFGTPKYMTKEMSEIIHKKEIFIDLYKNDIGCLQNVLKYLRNGYGIDSKEEKQVSIIRSNMLFNA